MPDENILSGYFIGTVMKIDKESRKVAVFLPKLMSAIYDGTATDYKYPTNSGLNITNITTNISSTVHKTNYIWVKPKNYDAPLPEPGSKVMVRFLDDNPKNGYWSKFNMNNDYVVIEEERYPEQFNIEFNDQKSTTIKQSDNINIKTPDYYDVVVSEENKNKTISIQENFNFYVTGTLEETINNLQKSMSYIEEFYKNSFIENLNVINFTGTTNDLISSTDTYEENFNKYKEDGLAKISNSNNLLDADTEYTYINKILNGLNDIYSACSNYYAKYILLSGETPATPSNFKLTDISSALLIENLDKTFDDIIKLTDKESIDKLIEYCLKIQFPNNIEITVITNNGTTTNVKNDEIVLQNRVFTKYDETDIPALTNDENDHIPDEVYLLDTEVPVCNIFTQCGWKDTGEHTLDENYFYIGNITVSPLMYGCSLVVNNSNKFRLTIINNDDGEDIDISSRNTDTIKTINGYHEMLIDNTDISNNSIFVEFKTKNKKFKLDIENASASKIN